MRKKAYPIYLFSMLFIIFTFVGMSAAQETTLLKPPQWSVGDWWIVESQVYDLGKVVLGSQPGWRTKQAWRFQVEKIDSMGDQPYFVVSVKPIKENSCPYSFSFWFRVSDRFVGRYELIHPSPTASKPKVIGPPVVTTDLSPTHAAPFFLTDFPTLPIVVPLFNVEKKSAAFPAGSGAFETSQEVEQVDWLPVAEKADSNLLKKMEAGLIDQMMLVKINTESGIGEQQYWKNGVPWSIYGERFDKTYTSRRYWLVDMGKD
jgi:hypothetical protein